MHPAVWSGPGAHQAAGLPRRCPEMHVESPSTPPPLALTLCVNLEPHPRPPASGERHADALRCTTDPKDTRAGLHTHLCKECVHRPVRQWALPAPRRHLFISPRGWGSPARHWGGQRQSRAGQSGPGVALAVYSMCLPWGPSWARATSGSLADPEHFSGFFGVQVGIRGLRLGRDRKQECFTRGPGAGPSHPPCFGGRQGAVHPWAVQS